MYDYFDLIKMFTIILERKREYSTRTNTKQLNEQDHETKPRVNIGLVFHQYSKSKSRCQKSPIFRAENMEH